MVSLAQVNEGEADQKRSAVDPIVSGNVVFIMMVILYFVYLKWVSAFGKKVGIYTVNGRFGFAFAD